MDLSFSECYNDYSATQRTLQWRRKRKHVSINTTNTEANYNNTNNNNNNNNRLAWIVKEYMKEKKKKTTKKNTLQIKIPTKNNSNKLIIDLLESWKNKINKKKLKIKIPTLHTKIHTPIASKPHFPPPPPPPLPRVTWHISILSLSFLSHSNITY